MTLVAQNQNGYGSYCLSWQALYITRYSIKIKTKLTRRPALRVKKKNDWDNKIRLNHNVNLSTI